MLIIDRNRSINLLPVYEVQEVSMKEALALLKSNQKNAADILLPQVDNHSPRVQGSSESFTV